MSVVTEPPKDNPIDTNQYFTWPWVQWFKSVFLITFAQQQSGPTTQRPTTSLWIGRRYFDTTLGKPVFLKSTAPNVWVDGVGTVS